MYNEKYDWETREDAHTLRRYAEIASDPARMAKAKSCIKDFVDASKCALSKTPNPRVGKKSNPATVGAIKVKF